MRKGPFTEKMGVLRVVIVDLCRLLKYRIIQQPPRLFPSNSVSLMTVEDVFSWQLLYIEQYFKQLFETLYSLVATYYKAFANSVSLGIMSCLYLGEQEYLIKL